MLSYLRKAAHRAGLGLVGAVALASGQFWAPPALATSSGTNQNCGGLQATPYVAPAGVQFNIVVADGDILNVAGTGTLFYQQPGGGSISTGLPASFPISTGNAGTWIILRSVAATFTCTVGGPPPTKRNETSNLEYQQAALSSILINHHAYTMASGVSANVGSGGSNGASNYMAQDGFFFSTRGSRQTQSPLLSAYGEMESNPTEPMWNSWLRGSYTHYNGSGSSFDGHIADIFAGLDYRVGETGILGMLVGYGNTSFDTVTLGTPGGFDADGFTIGAYTGGQLSDYISFDALIAYTGSDYDNRSGATIGSFDADRVTIAAHLKGRHEMGDYTIMPILSFLWANEDQDAYTDSAAVTHASRSISAGRVSIGPRIMFPERDTDSGSYQTWVSAKGEYDFSNQNVLVTTGLPDLGSVASLRIAGGVTSRMGEGTLNVRGDVSGIGSGEFTAVGGTVSYARPF